MPGFSSSGDDEVVHTESSDHHVARQKLRKQLEKVTDDTASEHQGMFHVGWDAPKSVVLTLGCLSC